MWTRAGRILFILYQAIFLNIVLPGHTRGSITLTGKSDNALQSSAAGCSCCVRKNDRTQKSNAPTPRDRANCAICHLAARITLPPTISFSLSPLGLVETLALPAPVHFDAFQFIPIYDGRGPPIHV